MLKNIVKNIENGNVVLSDIEFIWNLKDKSDMEILKNIIKERCYNDEIKLEINIYYPLIYQIENNCPTCGYRSSISRQKYTEEFIAKNIEYKLQDIDKENISAVNCYNKDITGLRELFIILKCLKNFDVRVNVALSNYDNLKDLNNYDINSIIYIPPEYPFNKKEIQENEMYEKEVIKYIKETMKLKVTYQLILNYNETHIDVFEIIEKLRKLCVDVVEIRGFDPFIDSPEEYSPQYSKEYILKIILILRLYLHNTELKIQYASNDNNHIRDYLELNVNSISGIYTKHLNSKLENTEKIKELIKR